jgi:hypothetical protein
VTTSGLTNKSLTVLRIPQQMEYASVEFKIISRDFFLIFEFIVWGDEECIQDFGQITDRKHTILKTKAYN